MKKISIPTLFAVAFVAFFGVVLGLQHLMFSDLKVPPEATFGRALPAGSQVISSLKAVDGATLAFYNPANQHKVSIARSKAPAATVPSGEALIDIIIKYQADGTLDSRMAPLSIRFLSAEFDARRANNFTVTKLASGYELTNFVTNHGANYSVAALRRGDEEILLIVYRKDLPVDSGYAEQVISGF